MGEKRVGEILRKFRNVTTVTLLVFPFDAFFLCDNAACKNHAHRQKTFSQEFCCVSAFMSERLWAAR